MIYIYIYIYICIYIYLYIYLFIDIYNIHPGHIEIVSFYSMGLSFILRSEGASLALVGHPSSDSVTRKASHPIFCYWVS